MSTNIKVIRYAAIFSVVLALLTYLISLNIAFEWFDLKFLSNTFLLSIFGGAFASMLVVLICELQKYIENKKRCEDLLFMHTGYIYGNLSIIETELKKQMREEGEAVDKDLIKINLERLKLEIDTIRNIDYNLLSKKNKFLQRYNVFRKWLIEDFSSFVSEGVYLPIAVNCDEINILKNDLQTEVMSTSPYTSRVISKLIQRSEEMKSVVDDYAAFIDDYCKNRFDWGLKKLSIERVTELQFKDIEDYIA